MRGYGLLYASLAWLCWGLAPALYKMALREMGPMKANLFRGVGIIAMFIPMFCFMDEEARRALISLDARSFFVAAMIAVANNMVGDVFYLAAIRDIGVSLACPITSAYPLAVTLAAWLWFGEAMSLSVLIGTLSVVAGLVLLNVRAGEETRGDGKALHARGVAAALLAALCWALGLSLNKYLIVRGVSPAGITFWRGIFFGFMTFASLPLMISGKGKTLRASSGSFFAASCAGVLALVLGGWAYANSLLLIPISVATPIASANPMLAAVLACSFMGERLRPVQWLGIVCVVGGAVAVSL